LSNVFGCEDRALSGRTSFQQQSTLLFLQKYCLCKIDNMLYHQLSITYMFCKFHLS